MSATNSPDERLNETPQQVLQDALYSENLSEYTRGLLRKRLESALENERARERQQCFIQMMHSLEEAVDTENGWCGGSEAGEPDCPRETGAKAGNPAKAVKDSSRSRPEGLTAGARWQSPLGLQDWRLP